MFDVSLNHIRLNHVYLLFDLSFGEQERAILLLTLLNSFSLKNNQSRVNFKLLSDYAMFIKRNIIFAFENNSLKMYA